MKKLFVAYETKNENGQLSANAAAIPESESLFWWLKDHQAVNCFWYPTWKEAIAAAECQIDTYKINKKQ